MISLTGQASNLHLLDGLRLTYDPSSHSLTSSEQKRPSAWQASNLQLLSGLRLTNDPSSHSLTSLMQTRPSVGQVKNSQLLNMSRPTIDPSLHYCKSLLHPFGFELLGHLSKWQLILGFLLTCVPSAHSFTSRAQTYSYSIGHLLNLQLFLEFLLTYVPSAHSLTSVGQTNSPLEISLILSTMGTAYEYCSMVKAMVAVKVFIIFVLCILVVCL